MEGRTVTLTKQEKKPIVISATYSKNSANKIITFITSENRCIFISAKALEKYEIKPNVVYDITLDTDDWVRHLSVMSNLITKVLDFRKRGF